MKKLLFIFFIIITNNLYCQKEFDKPWVDTTKAIILDPYSANYIDFDKIILNHRVTAIIHKASEGLSKDDSYALRRIQAKSKNLLWGSYHLGKSGDPIKQADFYLSLISLNGNEVIALDLEDVESSKFMNTENAKIFIEYIKRKTGRYPILYANQKVVKAISKRFDNKSVFANCPLWYARFKNKVMDFPKNVWETYTIWQFTCEINCCECAQTNKINECTKYNHNYLDSCPFKEIEGIKCDMDINVYKGTIEELREGWTKFGK